MADAVVPADNSFPPAKVMDLTVMLFSGGKERTEDELRARFEAGGWRLNKVIPTASPLAVLEGSPIPAKFWRAIKGWPFRPGRGRM